MPICWRSANSPKGIGSSPAVPASPWDCPAISGFALPTMATGRLRQSSGPAIVLSGSCSPATRRQIDVYRNGHPSLRLDAGAALDAGWRGEELSRFHRDVARCCAADLFHGRSGRGLGGAGQIWPRATGRRFSRRSLPNLRSKPFGAGFTAAGGGRRRDVRRCRFGVRSARAGGRAGDRYRRAGADPRWRASVWPLRSSRAISAATISLRVRSTC